MLNKLISALTWCNEHQDASDCHLCPMFKDECRPCVNRGEQAVIDFLSSYADLLEENKFWFGRVRWCDEDIKEALLNHGFDDCQENISVIKDQCLHHCFRDGMIETGWHYINTYIQENEESLKKRCEDEGSEQD